MRFFAILLLIFRILEAQAERNGIDGLLFVPARSLDVEDPPQVDVVVAEVLGNFAYEEDVLETLRDARRFLKPGGTLIPRSLTQWAAPVTSDRFERDLASWQSVGFGLDWSDAERMTRNNMYVFAIEPGDLAAVIGAAEPGTTVAIVGPTGAGKTTLVNLIMRFYELNGGRILLDGRNIAEMPRHELRSRIGMVLQDTWLFSGTIRENIAYGRANATEADVVQAARAAREVFPRQHTRGDGVVGHYRQPLVLRPVPLGADPARTRTARGLRPPGGARARLRRRPAPKAPTPAAASLRMACRHIRWSNDSAASITNLARLQETSLSTFPHMPTTQD